MSGYLPSFRLGSVARTGTYRYLWEIDTSTRKTLLELSERFDEISVDIVVERL